MRTGNSLELKVETAAELDALLPSILDKAFKGERDAKTDHWILPLVETVKNVPLLAFVAAAMMSGKHLTNFHACTQNGNLSSLPSEKRLCGQLHATLAPRADFF